MAFYIKQNDTRPEIAATLINADGTKVDLSGATVKFLMRKVNATAATVDASATVTDATNGKVKYTWIAADTTTIGEYEGEFQVTYGGGGGIQTFPNNRYIEIEITDDIA
jgi:5-hydroxyisourate hydrolase-like protein (transthyretin family)